MSSDSIDDFDEYDEEAIKQAKKKLKNAARAQRRKRKRAYMSGKAILVNDDVQAPKWKRVKVDKNVVFEAEGFFGLEELEFNGDIESLNLAALVSAPSEPALTEAAKSEFQFEPELPADDESIHEETEDKNTGDNEDNEIDEDVTGDGDGQLGESAEANTEMGDMDENEDGGDADGAADADEGDGDAVADEGNVDADADADADEGNVDADADINEGNTAENSSEHVENEAVESAEANEQNGGVEWVDATTSTERPLTKRELKGLPPYTQVADPALREAMQPWLDAYEGLHPTLLKGLQDLGFKSPTSIQKEVLLPALRDRKDIIGAAETGSGKTLAFLLPILHQLLEIRDKYEYLGRPMDNSLKALILAPTRELAVQIVDHAKAVAKYTGFKLVPLIGGIAIQKQERLLRKRPDILVATIGRLWDYLSQPHDNSELDFSNLRFLVLDEADKIIEFGRFQELQNVLGAVYAALSGGQSNNTKKPLQTFVFSATLALSEDARKNLRKQGKKIKKPKKKAEESADVLDKLTEHIEFFRKVEIVDISPSSVLVSTLEEAKIYCLPEEKDYYMYYFLERYKGRTLVFVNSIANIRRIVPLLKLLRVPAWPMHAKMQQRQRLKNIERFKSTPYSVLVSTDVMARGLDIPNIDHVIHYQIPLSAESYVHRSGRTARAQSKGLSLSIIEPKDKRAFAAIQKTLNKEEPKEFPVEMEFYTTVKKRVNLARKLNEYIHTLEKENASVNWARRVVEDADIEPDEEVLPELEGKLPKHKKKQLEYTIATMKQELADMLDEPLLPMGTSRKYIAKTPVVQLAQMESAQENKRSAITQLHKPKSKRKSSIKK